MARIRRTRAQEWLSLGEASRLLGVSHGTVRRWSDAGRLPVFTTPGGHRRFQRSSIERLLPADRAPRAALVRSGLTAARLARAYRQEARSAGPVLPWLGSLLPEQRDWFRVHGRRMVELLLGHLDADSAPAADHQLTEVTAEAAAYGRMAAGLGLSLSQTVEGFLHFRRPFLHELSLVARRRGFDIAETTELIEQAERGMDHLLVAAMAAHTVGRVRPARGGEIAR